MEIGAISLSIRIKHKWLLKAINIPLLLLGLRPYVPSVCIKIDME
jgi:hypothetical protein